MAIKLKNEVFNKGFIQGLTELQTKIEFDGDVAWELALFSQEVLKQANAYEKAIENAKRPYDKIHDDLIKKLGTKTIDSNQLVIIQNSENYNIFINDKNRLDAENKFNEQLEILNNKEVEYKLDKIVLNKAELKNLKLKSTMFTALFDILIVK